MKEMNIQDNNISLLNHFQLKCCGAEDYMDWKNTTFGRDGDSVPESCCITDAEGCGRGILATPDEVLELYKVKLYIKKD